MKGLSYKNLTFAVLPLLFSSCATLLGGKTTPTQVTKPAPGQSQRQIRPDYFIMDVFSPAGMYGMIVDFATGAIYKRSSAEDSIVSCKYCNKPLEFKTGVNFIPMIGPSYEWTNELTYHGKLGLTLAAGYADAASFKLDKKGESLKDRKTYGGFVKAGLKVYLFNTIMRNRSEKSDIIVGIHFIQNYYSQSAVDRLTGGYYYERGLDYSIAMSLGYNFRWSRHLDSDVGVQIRLKEQDHLNPYMPGMGIGLQGILNLKYCF